MKAIIIYGPIGSGKSTLARELAQSTKSKPFTVAGDSLELKDLTLFFNRSSPQQTIIIDDCPNNFDYDRFAPYINMYMPQLIFVTQDLPKAVNNDLFDLIVVNKLPDRIGKYLGDILANRNKVGEMKVKLKAKNPARSA